MFVHCGSLAGWSFDWSVSKILLFVVACCVERPHYLYIMALFIDQNIFLVLKLYISFVFQFLNFKKVISILYCYHKRLVE